MPGLERPEVVAIRCRSTSWSADAEAQEAFEALAAALGRHEIALARLKRTLPSPPAAIVRELEAAEQELRAAQARHDTIRR